MDYLANHLGQNYKPLLYEAVFAYSKEDKDAVDSKLSAENLWGRLDGLLREITVCDPACGSGSFLIGMLLALDDLIARCEAQLGSKQLTQFQRRKEIIANSLYGVDVMPWAAHVTELRLWLQLVVDSEIKWYEHKSEPMLPNLSFKVRPGDSLVQEVGGINLGHIKGSRDISSGLKKRATELKNDKFKFYNNDRSGNFQSADALKHKERKLFEDILWAKEDHLDSEIKSLKRKLEGTPEPQIRLDGTMITRTHKMDLEADKHRQEIEALSIELTQTEASRKALSTSKEVPFVWDIAFVKSLRARRMASI